MKNEIEQDIDREDDNPYKRVILNKVYKEEDKTPQMENWSIFSDNVRYLQHDEKTPHKLDPYIRLPTAQRALLQIERRRK